MSDPRNVAHDKKVKQEKEHHAASADATPKKRRARKASGGGDQNGEAATAATPPPEPKVEQAPGELEKSLAVLSKLKEMEFHSRANVETIAGLTLEIDDELKQKEFSEPIGALYSAQDSFQTKIAELITSYETKCESLKPSA